MLATRIKKLKSMKKILFLFVVIGVASCSATKSTTTEQVSAYYEGFKNSDYNQIKRTLADSLVTIEGDFTTSYSHESYYEQFKWDSVFKPKYKLVSIENQQGHLIATVSVHTSKFEFLKNNPLTFKHKFSFKSGKIAKIENIGFIDADFDIWAKQRAALVNWVKVNHPEIDGFMNDLTMQGALNYLQALEFYKNREKPAKGGL